MLRLAGHSTTAQRAEFPTGLSWIGPPRQIYGPPTISNIISGFMIPVSAGIMVWLSIFVSSSVSSSHSALNTAIMLLYLVVLLLGGMGLWYIFGAISKRNTRVVLCTHGVAYVQPSGSDSFRWQDVLTTTTTIAARGRAHQVIYTVHCHDGRKSVFKNISSIQDLAESVDVQVARARLS